MHRVYRGAAHRNAHSVRDHARQIMVASVMKAHQLLIDNLTAARGSRDDNDSLAGLIVTFFSGICLEQNLGPDRARITKKIDAFMRLIRAI